MPAAAISRGAKSDRALRVPSLPELAPHGPGIISASFHLSRDNGRYLTDPSAYLRHLIDP